MATKTFSGRADVEKIRLAEALVQQEYGISFGQYCGSMLVDYICETGTLPDIRVRPKKKKSGVATMLSLAKKHRNSEIGRMSDQEIKDLIVSRYE